LVREVLLLIFYSNTKLPTMIFYEFLVLFTGYNIWWKQVSIQKKKCQAHTSASEAYIKKITVACPTDKGDAGRLPSSPTSTPLCEMLLAEWICIRPDDTGTLTLVANKCSIVRNAPGRMNMHPPRQSEGDEVVTETRKAEAGEGDRRWKVGRSVY
jgi:hypothetical protein